MLACCPETKGWRVESEEKKYNCDPICNSNIDSSSRAVKSEMAVVPRVAEDKWKEAVTKGMREINDNRGTIGAAVMLVTTCSLRVQRSLLRVNSRNSLPQPNQIN
jgi:hypothetical protein